jgi:hypothetical protein
MVLDVWLIAAPGIPGLPNRKYFVRSAYRLCVKELIDMSHLHKPGDWSAILNLKVPPKVKNLVWRMCCGCLPTRIRLQDKRVHCPTNCVSCDSAYEDMVHVMFICPFTVHAWNMTGLAQEVTAVVQTADTTAAIVFHLLSVLSADHKQRMAAVFWSLWKHQNLKVWGNKNESCAMVVDRARVLIEEWHHANQSVLVQQASAHPEQVPV